MFKSLQSGELHQKITIQQPVETTNPDGQVVRTWNPYEMNRSASVMPVSGGERLWSGLQIQADSQYIVRMWNDSATRGIDSTMRVMWNGTRLGITRAYDPDNRRREIVLECREQQ